MKRIFFAAFMFIAVCSYGDNVAATAASKATCNGAKNCNACKNCKYCKHCAKDGGTCGVCK